MVLPQLPPPEQHPLTMRFGMGLTGLRDGRDLDVEMTNTVRTQYNMFPAALVFLA